MAKLNKQKACRLASLSRSGRRQVRKVIIPAAGFGTRMLPATKAQPKEMLPVLDKPTIQYIVEEAVAAGIRDIILVTGPGKRPLEDHFDRNIYLEEFCLKAGKKEAYEAIKHAGNLGNIIYIRQKGRYGNGTPVLNAKDLIGDEPFAVVWGDEIIKCPKGKTHLSQLIEVFEKYGDPVMTAYPTDDEGTKRYAMIEGTEVEKGVYQIKKLMEKPGPEKTKSRVSAIGGYILTPDIFEELEKLINQDTEELYLTEAIGALMKRRPIYAKMIEGTHYDTGNKFNWLKTNIEFGLQDKEIGPEMKKYLTERLRAKK